MKKKINKKWYKLDNAAKMFPPTTTKLDTKIFRISTTLKSNINKSFLTKALEITLKDYPIFQSTLKKGLFWYYIEETNEIPIVKKDSNDPCNKIKSNLLFELTYYNNRINLEVNHILTDGVGTTNFFNSIIINYLKLETKTKKDFLITTSSIAERENESYNKYYTKPKYTLQKSKKTYKLKGKLNNELRLKVIEALIPLNDVKKLAKEDNVSLTMFLTSILIKSILKDVNIKDYNKNIVIEIPVNLRAYFESNTDRNFFNTIKVEYNPLKDGTNFEKILDKTKKEFELKLTKAHLENKMNNFYYLEKNLFIRFVPLFIKNFVVKIIFKLIKRRTTIVFSNVGRISLPPDLEDEVLYYSVCTPTETVKVSMISYLNTLSITFTSRLQSNEIEKEFIRYFTNKNIPININSNEV